MKSTERPTGDTLEAIADAHPAEAATGPAGYVDFEVKHNRHAMTHDAVDVALEHGAVPKDTMIDVQNPRTDADDVLRVWFGKLTTEERTYTETVYALERS